MNLIDGSRVWWMHATKGIPLEITIPELAKRGYVPTWDLLLLEAEKDGTNLERLVRRLQGVVFDAYDKETAQIISDRLPLLLEWLSFKTATSTKQV